MDYWASLLDWLYWEPMLPRRLTRDQGWQGAVWPAPVSNSLLPEWKTGTLRRGEGVGRGTGGLTYAVSHRLLAVRWAALAGQT